MEKLKQSLKMKKSSLMKQYIFAQLLVKMMKMHTLFHLK